MHDHRRATSPHHDHGHDHGQQSGPTEAPRIQLPTEAELQQLMQQQATQGSSTPMLDAAASDVAHPLSRQDAPLDRQTGKQEVQVGGLPIQGEDVSPSAMDAASRVVHTLVGGAPEMQERMRKAGVRVEIVPSNKLLTDLDSFADLADDRTRDGTRDWSETRGIGGHHHDGDIVVGFPEENLVEVEGSRDLYGEQHNISLHEMAHAVHLHGLTDEQRERLVELYQAQQGDAAGFTDDYAASHVEEYFAQATQAFMDVSDYGLLRGEADQGDEWLRANDPDLYAFLESIYGSPEAVMERSREVDVRQKQDGPTQEQPLQQPTSWV